MIECGLLCSVPAIEPVLTELHRVLAPDGEFRFFDHARSDGIVGRSQDALTPLWRTIGGNCHLSRQVGSSLDDSALLDVREINRLRVGDRPIRTFVRGTAIPVT